MSFSPRSTFSFCGRMMTYLKETGSSLLNASLLRKSALESEDIEDEGER